jgi:hypothetical protein
MSESRRERSRERGPSPWSARTHRRLLGDLVRKAISGDVTATESILRLAMERRDLATPAPSAQR